MTRGMRVRITWNGILGSSISLVTYTSPLPHTGLRDPVTSVKYEGDARANGIKVHGRKICEYHEYDTRTQSLVTKEDSNEPIVGRAGGKAQIRILKEVQGKEEANRDLYPSGMDEVLRENLLIQACYFKSAPGITTDYSYW